MTDNQKPTIEELYAIAISSGTGFDRLVLAAGLQREIVGAMLLRLRVEYDQVRGDLERAGQIAPSAADRVRSMTREAQLLKAKAWRLELSALDEAGPKKRADIRAQAMESWDAAADLHIAAAAIQRRTPGEVQSARAFILLGLTTLHDAKQQLGALAVRMGAKPSRALAPDVALRLAGRVLDVWLDEVCHKCDGTGRLGNRYVGDRERECPACKGTGHRREILGESRGQTEFARDLFAEVQRQVGAASAGIKAALFREGAEKPLHPELARRLADLRGEQAAAD